MKQSLNIPVIDIALIRKRLNLLDSSKEFIVHEFNERNAPYFDECRMKVFFVALLQDGEINIEFDLGGQTLKGPALYAMAPCVLRKFVKASDNFKVTAIFFESSFFLKHLSDVRFLDKYSYFLERDPQLLRLTKQRYKKILRYFNIIKEHLRDEQQYSDDIIRNLIQVLLFEIANFSLNNSQQYFSLHNQVVLSIFKENLEKNFRSHRKVAYYASLQNLSSKYFSSVLHQLTGKTGGEIIDERVILEAKALLQKKLLNVKQVAESLNFDDASIFGKYFKNLTNQSPLAYRKSL